MQVTRHYLEVDGRLVHYRRSGRGPVVVMLHASPMSSAAVEPLMRHLAPSFTCLALDTAGYGQSDPLPTPARTLAPYVDSLRRTLDTLRLGHVLMYGQATGAQIGVEFAKRYPDRVRALVMDSAALFTPEEVERWLPTYLPPFRPRPDGSHLAWAWTVVRDMTQFFPWMRRTRDHRLMRPVPPATTLHTALLDLLRAGPGYRTAYAAAFRNEVPGVFDGVKVPTSIIAWDESVIRAYTDRIQSLPPNCRLIAVEGGVDVKSAAVAGELQRHAQGAPAAHADTAPVRSAARCYLNTTAGAVHVRCFGTPSAPPMLYLHAPLESSALLGPVVRNLARRHWVVAPDLAAHGETSVVIANDGRDLFDRQIGVLDAVCDWSGMTDFEVGGAPGSHALAQRWLTLRKGGDHARCRLSPSAVVSREPSGPVRDFTPRQDGSHLISAWHYIRDAELFEPWYRCEPAFARARFNLSAAHLHARTVELLKVRGPHELIAGRGYLVT